ncbi:TerD family protein [Nocardia fluminea]|uniref:Stress response protein SCP2 n=1 Tax=Nocardia fluminea TaxID=134984 RepID=A0A2N3V4N7_9NOCA|nr:TerD family protein [Nocardia fluminea]PKV76593.1 stress response protein SCP2 [Nocardia fluminea]
MELRKGAHAPVPTSLLAVVVSWRSAHTVDAHALLVTESGLVRGDRDFVFFNAPRHASQAVTLDQEPAPGTARLSISLPRTEPDVARIVVSASLDDATFDQLPDLTLTVHAADGPIARFTIDGIEDVQAMMFGEFYRRDGQWRFRAIGQGWSGGLAGLAGEFGVTVDEPTTALPGSTPGDGSRVPAQPNRAPSSGAPRTADRARFASVPSRHDASSSAADLPDADQRANWPSAEAANPAAARHDGPTSTRPPALSRRVIDVPPPPPADPEIADWHPDPETPDQLRWWDGDEWTSSVHPHLHDHRHRCTRCGNPLRRKLFGGHGPCKNCAAEIEEFLTHWRNRARRVLAGPGTMSVEWTEVWAALRFQRIDEERGRTLLREAGLTQVERMVAFAFADGEVFADELDAFEHVVSELALSGGVVDDLRRRMHRGRTLSRLRAGELPTVNTPGLHLDPEERVHLDLPAVHIRMLARGPRNTEGRLIGSSKKLRFVGDGTGIELPWNRVVSVHPEHGTVVLAATSARGGATFGVADPDYVAAALEGALRVSKRLVLTPGQLDSRSIPQDVKAQVWQRDGGACVECGDGHYLEFDHIIPLSRGGATSVTNLQILCRACNRAKGARI